MNTNFHSVKTWKFFCFLNSAKLGGFNSALNYWVVYSGCSNPSYQVKPLGQSELCQIPLKYHRNQGITWILYLKLTVTTALQYA